MAIEYTKQQQEKIKQAICDKLDKSFEVNKFGSGTPLWMSLAFILDCFNQGNYYGSIEVKIVGTSCNDAKEKEITHRLREIYKEP